MNECSGEVGVGEVVRGRILGTVVQCFRVAAAG